MSGGGLWLCVCVGFFFQGGGGIRGSPVTGVQTCALPIYQSLPAGIQFLVEPGLGWLLWGTPCLFFLTKCGDRSRKKHIRTLSREQVRQELLKNDFKTYEEIFPAMPEEIQEIGRAPCGERR